MANPPFPQEASSLLPRRILYYAPTELQFRRWFADLKRVEGCDIHDERYPPLMTYGDLPISWVEVTTPEGTLERLQSLYIHALLLDLRFAPEPDRMDEGMHQSRRLLEMLDLVEDLELRYGFHRIIALVSGPQHRQIDDMMVELGGKGIRHVLRQCIQSPDALPNEDEAVAFAGEVLDRLVEIFREPRRTTTALCLAGGGITGIYYELGALKCLDDCLSSERDIIPSINRFDMYFGISAGAVNAGILTAGYAVEEFMAALAGLDCGRITPLSLSLLKFDHINFRHWFERAKYTVESALMSIRQALFSPKTAPLDALMFAGGEVIGPPFHSSQFETMLATILSHDGTTNDFKKLPRSLFIGATDQDFKRHILFGAAPNDDIPISKAIQASLSIHPAFSSVEINGRYYEDGAVTRTSNFSEAIERGAGIVFVFDPFLPYVSRDVGYAHRRGILYNVDQDIRTLSYTRYESIRNWVLRKHPDVSAYTFVPSNRLRHLLSNNPMDHRPFLEIWRGAYLSTYRRIHKLQHRLRGDLEAFQIPFDLDRATAVKERLEHKERAESLRFDDFFPDGQIRIRRPPLALEQKK